MFIVARPRATSLRCGARSHLKHVPVEWAVGVHKCRLRRWMDGKAKDAYRWYEMRSFARVARSVPHVCVCI